MIVHPERKPPEAWKPYLSRARTPWLKAIYASNWLLAWIAHFLSRWALLEVLEYLGTFSVLIAVIFYFAESGDRVKQKHYQAWQVINTAQGKGGSGGRVEALQELNHDGVPLVGIELTDAFLQGVQLPHAQLARSNFGSADLRESSFASANLFFADFDTTNLRGADFHKANLRDTDFKDADLTGADLTQADVKNARFDRADLRYANLRNINWAAIASMHMANLYGAKNVSSEFARWAKDHGAVMLKSDGQWIAIQKNSTHP